VWNIDVTNRAGSETAFVRLLDKLMILNKAVPLPYILLENIKEVFLVEWTYNSNSIECNTLTLKETEMLLQEGIVIKVK
jgi:hypothetical protein